MKKKILCLLHLPPPSNGVTNLNKSIVEGGINRYFTLDVISINTSRQLNEIEKASIHKLFVLFRTIFVLLLKLIFNQYQFCYFSLTPTGIGFYKDIALVFILKIFRIRRIYHLHGKGISLRKGFLDRLLYRFCFHNSKVILVSKIFLYDVEKYIPRKDVFVLPNAIAGHIENEEFEALMRRRAGKSKANLLFLSNMIKNKGVFIALEAARIMRMKNYDFKFRFIGNWFDISEREFYNIVAKYNLIDVVEHSDFKEGREKNDILMNSDIFVFPTYNDIFSIVNIEAMEFGLPVISTDEGAIPEIVDNGVTGFIVSKKDPQGLAEKIEKLMNDPSLRMEMGRAGREKFLRFYKLDKFENRLADIFHKAFTTR